MKNFVGFLGNEKTILFAFEIYWPLVDLRSSWSATTLDTLKIGSPISAQPKRKVPYQRSQSTPSGGPSSSKNSLNQSSNAIEKMNKMSGTSEEQEKLKSAQKSKQSSESNGNTSSKGY